MSAVAKMRLAGFAMAISEQGGLLIDPASKLTAEQRAFIKQNKVVLLAELRQEQPMQDVKPLPAAGAVCCGDCRHGQQIPDSDAVYGWRRCSLGVADGGGFARADRRCSQFEAGEIQSPEIDLLANRIDELVADGWATWNARAKAESELLTTAVYVATATMVNPRTTIGLVELPADVIAAHPALPPQIPIAGARYSQWRVRFADGRSAVIREPEPSTFDDAWRYAASLTGFASVEPITP
jgi:hypothetical protein